MRMQLQVARVDARTVTEPQPPIPRSEMIDGKHTVSFWRRCWRSL